MTHEPPTAPRWRRFLHPRWWLTILTLAAVAWSGWREYDRRAAIDEAKAAGYEWESQEPFDLIRADWHAAFRKETWTESYRQLDVGEGHDLATLRPLLLRLRVTRLIAHYSKDTNLDALKGLTGLQSLNLSGCPALQNVDALKGLADLQQLDLRDCPALQNVDALKGLSGLQVLDLSGCPALQNVDVLKDLTGLRFLDLSGCPALQNVDGLQGLTGLQRLSLSECTSLQNVGVLKGLTGLQWLDLAGCTKLPLSSLRELRAALPGTIITFPSGASGPQP